MHYKQIIENYSPFNMWTFERYSGDLANVFDEFPENRTLLNNGATLEEAGQVNQNFSGKSANVKNGTLLVADGTFLDTPIANRDFTIMFCFKTDGTEITGIKPLVSKWAPDQQFFIGFENGEFTGKIQTTGGMLEVTFDNKHVIYNNYWNQVIFHVDNDSLDMWLNGLTQKATLTGAINPSTLSQFTIGSPAPNPHTTDVWINDIAIFEEWNTYLPLIAYKMTRSDKDCWLGMAPKFFYDMVFWWKANPNKPIPNEGYGGSADCSIVQMGGTTPPVLFSGALQYEKQGLRLPPNSWLTIDADIDLDWQNGWTLATFGGWDFPYANRGRTDTVYGYLKFWDFKVNGVDDSWRIFSSAEAADASNYHSLGYQSRDAAGDVVGSYGSYLNQDFNSSTPTWGINLQRITSTQHQFKCYLWNNWVNARTTTRATVENACPIPYTWNRFFYQNGNAGLGSDRYDLAEWGLFEYLLDDNEADFLHYPRVMIMRNYLNSRYAPRMMWGADYNITSPQWRDFINGSQYTYTTGHSVTYTTGVVDPLSNRQNYFPNAAWFSDSLTNWTGQNYQEDGNDIYINDFILNFWIWNRNTERRYEAIVNHYSSAYPRFTTTGYGPCVGINSKDKLFEYGCVEFSIKDAIDPDYTVYVENAVPDDGFHMITCIRRGYVTELWIDAVLRAKKVAPTIWNAGTSNRPFLTAGDSCYIYELFMDTNTSGYSPWNQTTIEHLFQGYPDVVKGQTLLNGQPLPSKLYAIRHDTGDVITADATDDQGRFEFSLPKSVNNQAVDVVALPQDETATNHVVVHGPYSANTVYSRYVEEVFDSSLKDMYLDFAPERYYPMDDIVGTNVPDNSGNGHDGTIIGTDYTISQEAMEKNSKSIRLNGTDAYIDMPDGFDGLSAWTFTWWTRIMSSSSYARFFDLSSAPSGGNADLIYAYRVSTNADLGAGFSGQLTAIAASGALDNAAWAHHAYRLLPDGTGELWVNGFLYSTIAQGTAIPQNIRTDNYIGKSSYTDANLNAYMSHFAFFDYALPTEEIKKQSSRGFTANLETMRSRIKSDKPFAYWTFDRLNGLTDDMGDVDFVATGAYAIEKNALVINKGAIGNNYLQTDVIKVNDANNNKWSVEVLVKTGTTNTDGVIVSEWNQGTADGVFKLCLDSGGFFRLYVASEVSFIQSSIQYTDDKFHHVVVTYNGDTIKLYVDNSFEASVSSSLNYTAGNDLTVGNTSDGDAAWFLEGETHIDDLAIYDYELELVQIENHYNLSIEKKDTL